jgi:hypothetical protein
MGIATGLGMQWTLGITSFVALIILGIPCAYYFALIEGGGLSSVWNWMNPPYLMINVILLIALWHTDWDAISAEIIERECVGGDDENNGDGNEDAGNTAASSSSNGFGSMPASESSSLLPRGNVTDPKQTIEEGTTNGYQSLSQV